MKFIKSILQVSLAFFLLVKPINLAAHEIFFCGERIPLTEEVARKLMSIIKKQISYNVVGILKQKDNTNLRTIEMCLEKTGLPDDFKYLAIVESGIKNVVSSAGAAGFWQLMPETARELGLTVNGLVDERNDLLLSTQAACKHLANYYNEIRKKHKVSSWVLTAAAYNFGSGNMGEAIRKQGNNYFKMNLNKETAEYVYKIIAVKELFEYPELYMKDFGYNVFNPKAASKNKKGSNDMGETDLGNMNIEFNSAEGYYPKDLSEKTIKAQNAKAPVLNKNIKSEKYVFAHISGNYKNFKDGDEITIILEDYLDIDASTRSPGISIKGTGWKINDKIFIDLNYGNRLIVVDFNSRKHDGILVSTLKNNEKIYLKVTKYYN